MRDKWASAMKEADVMGPEVLTVIVQGYYHLGCNTM
jgi:hypothetical protein